MWLTENCSFVTKKNQFTTDITLYIPQANNLSKNKPEFTNYPNPITSSTTFEYYLENDGEIQIDLLNSFGAVVQTMKAETQNKGLNKFSIYDFNQAPGLYVARLYINNNVIASKTIIVK